MNLLQIPNVGYLKYHVVEGDEQVSPFIELMAIYVEPEQRGNGWGETLISELMKIAKQQNCTCVYVKVTPENRRFQSFLKKNGFTLAPKILCQKRASVSSRGLARLNKMKRKYLQ